MVLEFDLERDELAKRLGGGLPSGSLCLIEGSSGSGKSVIAQRLMYGTLTNGHRSVYVSTEFTTPAFMDQLDNLGYPVLEPFADEELMFASTNPLLGHPVPEEELLPRLLEAKDLVTEPVVFVDVFSQMLEPQLRGGDPDALMEDLVRQLKQINAVGTTLVLTIDPDHLEGADVNELAGAADVRLECDVEQVGNNLERSIIVRKFARAEATVGDVIRFRVEPGAGFIVEIKAVA